MSEKHLELEDALTELGGAVAELKTEQELRAHALALAVQVHAKPDSAMAFSEILDLAAGFHAFLSSDGSDG